MRLFLVLSTNSGESSYYLKDVEENEEVIEARVVNGSWNFHYNKKTQQLSSQHGRRLEPIYKAKMVVREEIPDHIQGHYETVIEEMQNLIKTKMEESNG